jgi:hypothetical protein
LRRATNPTDVLATQVPSLILEQPVRVIPKPDDQQLNRPLFVNRFDNNSLKLLERMDGPAIYPFYCVVYR